MFIFFFLIHVSLDLGPRHMTSLHKIHWKDVCMERNNVKFFKWGLKKNPLVLPDITEGLTASICIRLHCL